MGLKSQNVSERKKKIWVGEMARGANCEEQALSKDELSVTVPSLPLKWSVFRLCAYGFLSPCVLSVEFIISDLVKCITHPGSQFN